MTAINKQIIDAFNFRFACRDYDANKKSLKKIFKSS